MKRQFYKRATRLLSIEPGMGPKKLSEFLGSSEPTAARIIARYRGELHGHSSDPRYVLIRETKEANPTWGAQRIAQELNISVDEAKLKLARYYGAIQPGPKTAEPSYNHCSAGAVSSDLYEKAKDLIREGAGPTKIAESLNVSEPTARRIIERRNGELEGHAHNPVYDAVRRLKSQYPQWGAKRLAATLGIAIEQAKFWLARYAGAMTRQGTETPLNLEKAVSLSKSETSFTYSLTAGNAKGGNFEHIQLVIPERVSALTKELVYTALSRTNHLSVIVKGVGPIVLPGNGFSIPNLPALIEHNAGYQPKKGVFVKSRVEYIIYQALERSGLAFAYEEKLQLENGSVIRPDFTIHFTDGTRYFWEHLGFDSRKYQRSWCRRIAAYKSNGLFDSVLTTDDLNGIDNEKLDGVIQDIKQRKLAQTAGDALSNHHYSL